MNRSEFTVMGARLVYWLALGVAAFIGTVVVLGRAAVSMGGAA